MDEWNEKEDPYKILGLDQDSHVTEADIKKVGFGVLPSSATSLTAKVFPALEGPVTRSANISIHHALSISIACLQAYRKLALTKHPDKQRDNPNAAAEFNAIQRAYEKVLDPGFRDAWNQLAK